MLTSVKRRKHTASRIISSLSILMVLSAYWPTLRCSCLLALVGVRTNRQWVRIYTHAFTHTVPVGLNPCWGSSCFHWSLTLCVFVCVQQHPIPQRITLSVLLNGSKTSIAAVMELKVKIFDIRYSQGWYFSTSQSATRHHNIYYEDTGSYKQRIICHWYNHTNPVYDSSGYCSFKCISH